MFIEKKHFPLLFLVILIIGVYFQQFIKLVEQWWVDPNYGHGFLIPVISFYFVWQKRQDLANFVYDKSNLGLIILIFGLFICLIGTAAAEFFTVRFSFIIIMLGIITYLYGKEFTKEVWFPILFLVFMIPIPYVIYYAVTFPMQLLSTKAATIILQLIGLPALRQGNIINLPNYSLEVIEACSGLRSLITLSALAAAMAYMTQKSAFNGILLFAFSVPVAIAANIFRIIITALGAFFISPKFAEGFLHEASGLIVFLVGFLSLGAIAMIIKWMGSMESYDPLNVEEMSESQLTTNK